MTAQANRVPANDGLRQAAGLVYALAVLTLAGGVAGGLVLLLHSVPKCIPNPYDASLTLCTGSRHPFTAAGIGLTVGAAVQAAVLFVIGRLCVEVATLRAAAKAAEVE